MFKTATDSNRVVTSELDVSYKIEPVEYKTGTAGEVGVWYRVTRIATKEYSYVNMTEAAAKIVARQRVAMYTRGYSQLLPRESDEAFPRSVTVVRILTDVKTRPVAGPCWSVEVNVSEKDVKATDSMPYDPAELFEAENARSYDDGDGAVKIIEAVRNGNVTTVLFDTDLSPEVIETAMLQFKLSETETAWSVSAAKPSAGLFIAQENIPVGSFVRIVCGFYESNVESVLEPHIDTVTLRWATCHIYSWGQTQTIYGSVDLRLPFDVSKLKAKVDGVEYGTQLYDFDTETGEFSVYLSGEITDPTSGMSVVCYYGDGPDSNSVNLQILRD